MKPISVSFLNSSVQSQSASTVILQQNCTCLLKLPLLGRTGLGSLLLLSRSVWPELLTISGVWPPTISWHLSRSKMATAYPILTVVHTQLPVLATSTMESRFLSMSAIQISNCRLTLLSLLLWLAQELGLLRFVVLYRDDLPWPLEARRLELWPCSSVVVTVTKTFYTKRSGRYVSPSSPFPSLLLL